MGCRFVKIYFKMTKQEFREKYLVKRKELSSVFVAVESLKITDILTQNFDIKGKTVHCFVPITKNNEIDTWLLIDRILEVGKVVIPKTNLKENTLCHYYFDKSTELELSKFKILEPVNAKECNPKEIDIVIVPLLIFDKEGSRIGYGGGFYDRFISELNPKTKLIGVSLFEPIEKIKDLHKFDKKLNFCITPTELYSF